MGPPSREKGALLSPTARRGPTGSPFPAQTQPTGVPLLQGPLGAPPVVEGSLGPPKAGLPYGAPVSQGPPMGDKVSRGPLKIVIILLSGAPIWRDGHGL